MTPIDKQPPAQPTGVNAPASKELDPNKLYVLVLPGALVGVVLNGLDACGRGAGADAGEVFWQVRGHVKQQLLDEQGTEANASGLIAGRDAQRAEARTAALKKEAAEATAAKTTAKRPKK